MTRSALRNPYAIVALSLIIVILGVVSYQKMVVDIFPDINIPVIAVATFYKGMGPSEIEGAITLRLEQLYLQASYVEHIESRSLPGISLIKIYFHPAYDVNAGVAEITSLTYSALRYLPKGMFPPTIIKFGASSLPIAQLTVSSPTLSEKEVRDLAYFTIRPQLGVVPGAAPLPPEGGTIRQVTVFLDRERMQARGISAGEIVHAVNAQNVLIPAGDVNIGDFDYNVFSNSMVQLVTNINDIPVKIADGVPVFLKDVATAADSTAVQTNAVRINGRRAVYIPILKQAGANTIAVIDGIKETLQHLTGLPNDMQVKLIFDQSLYIRNAIQTLQHEMLLGGGLACLMILLFLGSLRAMLIVALAIPLSILSAVIFLSFTGQTINIMTLGGLALSVGTLVDNSIVVLENIHRHLEMGKPLGEAVADGASEVALPMLVITISILIVYLPIVFFTGIIRFLFVPLALAVVYAMGASYVASLTVAPVAVAALERTAHEASEPLVHQHPRGLGWLVAVWSRVNVFECLVERYVRVLRWGLRHKGLVVGGVVAVLVGSLLLVPRLQTEFFPKVDAGQFILTISAPEGTRLEKTEAIIGQIEELIKRRIPSAELDQILADMGIPPGWNALYSQNSGPHASAILVSLVHDHQRSTWDYIDLLRADLQEQFPGLKFGFQTGGLVSDVLNFGLPAPVDIKISGSHLKQLVQTAEEVRELLTPVDGVTDVRVLQGMHTPELHLNVDRTKAAYFGMTEQQVMVDVTTALTSNLSLEPSYWIDPKSNNAYFVVAQYPEQDLTKFADFLNTPLVSAKVDLPTSIGIGGDGLFKGSSIALQNTPYSGEPLLPSGGNFARNTQSQGPTVLLKDVVEVVRKEGPEQITRFNLRPTIDVLAGVPGNDLGRVARAIETQLANVQLPKGVQITLLGEVNSMRQALSGFAGTLPIATLLVYLVMVALLRSFIDPLIILSAVPLGFIGVIWMLLATQTSVNVESQIGMLMMIGIVVSNSVLLVDFANGLIRQGMAVEEAVGQAG
ncbi:MAG TPA: efflux RND transporter permease subunit, partial [Candidatus Binatia bacterium]|nr:efflux RND transporter permease subunit [Candidatus Binatia bacterium]